MGGALCVSSWYSLLSPCQAHTYSPFFFLSLSLYISFSLSFFLFFLTPQASLRCVTDPLIYNEMGVAAYKQTKSVHLALSPSLSLPLSLSLSLSIFLSL